MPPITGRSRVWFWTTAILALATAGPGCAGCSTSGASSERVRQDSERRPQSLTVVERIYDVATGVTRGWEWWGWSQASHGKGRVLSVVFADWGGFLLGHPGLQGTYGGLVFVMQPPEGFGGFLQVYVDDDDDTRNDRFPEVAVGPEHSRALPDGWSEVFVPMRAVNPEGARFDRIGIRARREVPATPVLFRSIGLTQESGETAPPPTAPPARARFKVSCAQPKTPISPLIYGIAWSAGANQADKPEWRLDATACRFGGNPTTRFNWEQGSVWSTGVDWFFMNVDFTGNKGWNYGQMLDANRAHGLVTALTVPTIGWVAKDGQQYSFPVSVYGKQQAVAPENPDAGNGVSVDGKPIAPGPPTRTSVPMPPESVGRWVRAIRARDGTRGRSVWMYILDNEPMLWNSTHRDVHPEPVSYEELLDRTVRYATAVRQADPEAVIAGPALWGWPAYFYSALDAAWSFTLAPDRLRHGNVPLLAWWLRKLREHRERTGVQLVDVVDVHFYPAAPEIGGGDKAGTDAATAAKRIRSTRGLWDPTYRDESWVDDTIMLVPRLRKWIDENNPGLGISIGEWSFGAERHQSGGLATAEALGRFGVLGVTSAFYWVRPPENSPAFWAFRAYRNFDGRGGRFLDRSVHLESQAELASLFVSQDDSGEHLVAVLLNHDPARPLEATLDLSTCGTSGSVRGFSYAGGPAGLASVPVRPAAGGTLVHQVAPYSITVLDIINKPS